MSHDISWFRNASKFRAALSVTRDMRQKTDIFATIKQHKYTRYNFSMYSFPLLFAMIGSIVIMINDELRRFLNIRKWTRRLTLDKTNRLIQAYLKRTQV